MSLQLVKGVLLFDFSFPQYEDDTIIGLQFLTKGSFSECLIKHGTPLNGVKFMKGARMLVVFTLFNFNGHFTIMDNV